MSNECESYMRRAIELAAKGEGLVEPNPMVGCVLVKNERIIGEGWHPKFGEAHAEVNALESAVDPEGSTAYVTLEPCNHHGKTGPCTESLIAAGVTKVFIGCQDPNPAVAGQGISKLQAAGIDVEVNHCEQECAELIRPFKKLMETSMPWVIAKWAMTLDGKIATSTGSSKWISNASSRQVAHRIRGRMDSIIAGIGTVLADDPLLTARPMGPRLALRVVVDSSCRIPLDSQLVKTANKFPLLVATSKEADIAAIDCLREKQCEVLVCDGDNHADRIQFLLKELGDRGQTNVLVEGGSGLLGTLNDQNLIDEVHCFIAAKIVGGEQSLSPLSGLGIVDMNQAQALAHPRIENIDNDIYVSGRINRQAMP